MAAPTLDRSGAGTLPDAHTIDAHLAAERAALDAERRSAMDAERRRDLGALLRAAGLGLALAGTIGIGWNHTHQPDATVRTCAAKTVAAPGGGRLHQDPSQACAWVDEDGRRVAVDAQGKPKG